jgi:hypothetical protein
MVDVSRIDARDFNGKSIHVPVPAHCPYQGMATQPSKSFYVLHHYLGTWEQFSFRDDPRKGKGDPRHRDVSELSNEGARLLLDDVGNLLYCFLSYVALFSVVVL